MSATHKVDPVEVWIDQMQLRHQDWKDDMYSPAINSTTRRHPQRPGFGSRRLALLVRIRTLLLSPVNTSKNGTEYPWLDPLVNGKILPGSLGVRSRKGDMQVGRA